MYPFELDSFRIVFARWQADANAENTARQSEPEQANVQPVTQGSFIGKIGARAMKRLGIGVSGLLLLGLGLHTCGSIEQAKAQLAASIMG